MHIIAKGKGNKFVLMATDEELLKLLGSSGPVIGDMFAPGTQIIINAVWDNLVLLKNKGDQLEQVATSLETAAAKVRQLKPTG